MLVGQRSTEISLYVRMVERAVGLRKGVGESLVAQSTEFLNVNIESDNLMDRGKEFHTWHVSGTKEYRNEFVCANC